MTLDIVRLLFDGATVVLIWLVQLVIYPGFLFYTKEDLMSWHPKYTVAVTYVVLPLMTGQLVCVGLQFLEVVNWYSVSSAAIVAILWVVTFARFVPMHNVVATRGDHSELLHRLVRENWYRTGLWSALFVLSVLYLL